VVVAVLEPLVVKVAVEAVEASKNTKPFILLKDKYIQLLLVLVDLEQTIMLYTLAKEHHQA
jgi:hypothetical protein|tara:strand:+ start:115 stop:297 length:183 start_codon:yes stop_codon:yes gene_type:complete